MRTMLLFTALAGLLQAEAKRDFFERYDKLHRFTPGARKIWIKGPVDAPPARCSVALREVPVESRDTGIARPVRPNRAMPQVHLPAPPCSNQ